MNYFLPLLGALVLVGAGCSSSPPSSATPAAVPAYDNSTTRKESDRSVADRTGDTSQAADAEAALGINLPDDTGILTLIENQRAIAVGGRTTLSVTDARDFFTTSFTNAGLQAARPWGSSPLDSETLQSASYRGNGETWSINLRAEGNMTTFDITRQF